jgi:hypothetical protein
MTHRGSLRAADRLRQGRFGGIFTLPAWLQGVNRPPSGHLRRFPVRRRQGAWQCSRTAGPLRPPGRVDSRRASAWTPTSTPQAHTKPGSLLKSQIPIRTWAEWNEGRPGFVEIDLVGHEGGHDRPTRTTAPTWREAGPTCVSWSAACGST